MKHTTVALCILCLLVSASALAQTVQTQLYGYMKLDVAYDNNLSSHGNFILYVPPQPQSGNSHTLSFTARQTRLGLKLKKDTTTGILEVDFYGGGTENKNSIALRKAYVDIPLKQLTLRAGQAVDIIAPLNPTTSNYSVGYGAGNIGYRRPQLALLFDQQPYYFSMGITRSLGADLNNDTVIDGEASGLPTFQSRTGLQFSKMSFGASGHYGLMKADGASQEDYASWSVTLDGFFKIAPTLSIKGEVYRGTNTAAYYGAIANPDCVNELQSQGGWANILYDPKGPLSFSFGAGLDDLCHEEQNYLSNLPDSRVQNAFEFAFVKYALSEDTQLGFEISHWKTKYRNPSPGNAQTATDVRLQWSIQSNF